MVSESKFNKRFVHLGSHSCGPPLELPEIAEADFYLINKHLGLAHHPMDLFTMLNQLFVDLIQGGSDLFKLGANSALR